MTPSLTVARALNKEDKKGIKEGRGIKGKVRMEGRERREREAAHPCTEVLKSQRLYIQLVLST